MELALSSSGKRQRRVCRRCDSGRSGLKDDLLKVVGHDVDFSSYYISKIAPKYKLAEKDMPPTLINILDRFSGDYGPRNDGIELIHEFIVKPNEADLDQDQNIPIAIVFDNFLRVSESLENCRGLIRDIVKEHWDFRELSPEAASVSVNIEGGVHMADTKYNISNAQVGAIGPDAHVHDVQFHQSLERASHSFDLNVLAEQLDQLRSELAKLARDRDQYAAVVAVSDASADARAGKGSDALAKLAAAGKLTLDLATKIGVSVAADAIKCALNIK